jgi:5-methylcytosine-specific restriction endonuclease McrA
MNKTQVKALLVAERKSMREKQKQSLWMSKTRNIYNAMQKRAEENEAELPFSLVEFREFVEVNPQVCIYCCESTKPSTWTMEHFYPISRGGSFKLHNLYISCKSCNWQKGGVMDGEEFRALIAFLGTMRPNVAADVKRRLTIGGKWGVRVG